jgi:Ser/Thr protein kinase RdoA (MazF antagonist)
MSIENYGLIHTDIHAGNFLVDQNQNLTVFDFDDCAYFYFLSDIAIAIFYTVFFNPNRHEISKPFITALLKGYMKQHVLKKSDFLQIELFFKLRILILYLALKRSTQPTDPFTQKYNSIYFEDLKNHRPFLNMDYEALYDEIAFQSMI